MSSEKLKSEVYSLHRYINEDGTPDFERIFPKVSEGDSELWYGRHMDPNLLKIWDNQPDIVKEDKVVKRHFENCEECRKKLESRGDSAGSIQIDIPFDV